MTAANSGMMGDLSDLLGVDGIRMSDSEPVSELGHSVDVAPSSPSDGSEIVRQLNSLLRGEISAAETYGNALEKVSSSDHADHAAQLRMIQQEHGRACQTIRDRIRELGGEPADSSGAWGTWASVVQGTMSLFGGEKGAIKALKEGEEHGLRDFNSALPSLDPTTTQLIQNQMIPAQERHISTLDDLLMDD